MLRSQGIPARYATGIVSFSYAELQNWIEIPNPIRAGKAMLRAGFQDVSNSGGRTSFNHAWVQAFVPLERYRGNDSANPIDCMATPAVCAWVNLDPSFKQREYRDPAELVDVSDAVLFDYPSYYRAEDSTYPQPDGLDRREKNPLEIYEEMILQHLRTTPELEGKTLEDVVYEGQIIDEVHGILPTSTPFRFDPAAVSTYSSVDEHDADPSQFDWTKTVSFTVEFPKFSALAHLTLSGGTPVPLSDLANKNLIVAYESTDFSSYGTPKKLVARLGDQIHETMFTLDGSIYTSNGGDGWLLDDRPDVDTPFDVTLTMVGNGGDILTAVYPDLTLGGHFLVATGGEFSGFAEVRRSAQQLLEDVEQNPVIDDGSGVLYVDQNGDGVIDAGEPTLLEDAATQRLLTGGVLAVARDLYFARVRAQLERLAKLQWTTMPPSGFLGVVSSAHDVQAVAGTAFSVTPVGLLVDMKKILVTSPYKIDQDNARNQRAFRLAGHALSSLEHEIWQELTGFEAISTMKGIQRTNRDGGVLMELDEGQTQVTIPEAMTNWGFRPTLPSGVATNNLRLFSHKIWFPRTTSASSTKTFSVIRETVTSGNSALEKRGWDIEIFRKTNGSGHVYGNEFENLFRFVYDNYELFQSYPPDTLLDPPQNLAVSVLGFSIPGCARATTTGEAVSNYPVCFAALMDRPELQGYRDYLDFFDKDQSFVFGEHLYRDVDPARHISAQSLAPLRNEIALGADEDGDGVPDGDKTTEIVIPSIVADGELIDFAVWIQRYLDDSGIEYKAGYIINRAGGGYVSGSEPIDIYDSQDLTWSNELFYEESVVGIISNSIFTPSTGDPVSTVNGNLYHDETDLRIKGRGGLDYVFTRTYNSTPTKADKSGVPMGRGWTHSYNVRLISRDYGEEPDADIFENRNGVVSSITYVDERGGEHLFGLSEYGALSSRTVSNPRGNFDTLDLSQAGSNLYTLEFRSGTQYVFGGADLSNEDAVARLLYVRDIHGNELAFGYDADGNLTSITENLGDPDRTGLTLTYYDDGRLQKIEDWTGREWEYAYDATGNLRTAANPLGHEITYNYAFDDLEPRPLFVAGPGRLITDHADDALSVFAADVDGDGDLDALSASSGVARIAWYENAEGDGTSWNRHTISASASGARSVYAADVDGDGDCDVLSASSNDDRIAWYENAEGDGTHWTPHSIATDADAAQAVFAADIDGDGDLDVLSASYLDDKIAWYENTQGDGTAWNTHIIATDAEWARSVFAADVDGDGDLDVLSTSLNDYKIAWYENAEGNGTAWNTHTITTDASDARSVFAGDADGDGDTDVLSVVSYRSEVGWYENTHGDGTAWNAHKISTDLSGASSIFAADVDGDGDLDALATNYHEIAWYDNAQGDGTAWHKHIITLNADLAISVFAADVDGDGDLDALSASNGDDKIAWYENLLVRGPEPDQLTAIVKPESRNGDRVTTTFEYYENGRAFSNANALGEGEQLDYDLYRKRTQITDPRGFVTSHFYDSNGELTKVTRPDGAILTFQHNADGRRWGKTDALGYATQYSYCTAQTLDGCDSDAGGNVTLESDPMLFTKEYEYGPYDQIARLQDKTGAERISTYYDHTDGTTGAFEGKLETVRIQQLGAHTDVVLERRFYSPDGNLKARVEYFDPDDDGKIRTTEYTYNDSGENPAEVVPEEIVVTGWDGQTVRRTFEIDDLGRITAETLRRSTSYADSTPLPLTTRFEYDDLDRVTRITDPALNQQESIYDANGMLTETRRCFWLEGSESCTPWETPNRREYDAADRLIEERDERGGVDEVTAYAHDEAGNVLAVTGPTGQTLRYAYDAMSRRTEVVDENGHRAETTYDLAGNPIRLTDPTGRATTSAYDANGRLVEVADALHYETRFDYDGEDRLTKTIDANAVVDQSLLNSHDASEYRAYDELGRLVRVVDALDHETLMSYDLLGNLTSLADAEGRTTVFEYDGLGRLAVVYEPFDSAARSEPDPADPVTTYAYDEAGNRIYTKDRKGVEEVVDYDALNRPITSTILGTADVTRWGYDEHERLASIENADVRYDFTYDAKDRLETRTDSRYPGQPVTYGYDAAGRLVTRTDAQGSVTEFQYDGTGRLASERNADSLEVSYQYDGAGRVLSRILSNGARTAYRYDAAGRLEELSNWTADGTLLQRIRYDERDRVGNVKQLRITHADGSVEVASFDYDPLHRLTDAVYTVDSVEQEHQSFSYDAVGNRKTKTSTRSGLPIRHYLYDETNRLTEIHLNSEDGPLYKSFEYNENGNLTIRRNAGGAVELELHRDARGRVTSVDVGGTEVARYRYDPLGYRIEVDGAQGVRRSRLDAEHLEALTDEQGNPVAKFLRGSVIDEVVNADYYDANGKVTNLTYHHDALQSVMGLSGHAGTVEEALRYGPFGELLSPPGATPSRLRFTGREFDVETGLYYYRARYYDPEIGRFLSEDPLGFGAGDVNLYAYVGNNPINFNDPKGEIIPQLVGGAVGSITAVVSTRLANPEASAKDLLVAAGLGFGGGFLLATPFAATGVQVLAAGTLVGGATNFTTQAIFKGVENVDLVETGIFAGLGGFASIPSAAAATAELGVVGAVSLTVAQAPKGVVLDLLGGTFAELAPDLPVGKVIDNLDFTGSAATSLPSADGGFVDYPNDPDLDIILVPYGK